MSITRRGAVAALALSGLPLPALAQPRPEWPTRPVRFLVP